MAINTNALTLGSSVPAKTSFQTRAGGTGSSQVGNDQNPAADPGTQTSGSDAAAQDSGSDSPVQAPSTAQKNAGPSAQTRANARTGRPPAPGSAAAGIAAAAAAGTDSTEAAAVSNADFGSVMATALGRSAASAAATTAPAAPAKAASSAPDSTSAAQPAATTPGDAVAWIAQVLTPTAAGSSAIDASDDTTEAATAGATMSAGMPGATAATTTQLVAVAAGALRKQITGEFSAPTPSVPSDEAGTQTNQGTQAAGSTTALGSVNAMADVQKLISGLTAAAATDAGNDSGAAIAGAPVAHTTPTTGAADDSRTATALQAAGLTRSDGTPVTATLSIRAPVGSAAFADEVSAGITGLAQSGITQAQLQLSPADLGPVQVHITLQSGQASVWFGASHADTRVALEQSLPRLRELFAGAGMPLTDSGVFREPPQQQQTQALPGASSSRSPGSDTHSAPTVTQVSNIRLSLLDTYA